MNRVAYIFRRNDGATLFDEKLCRMLDKISFRCAVITDWNDYLKKMEQCSDKTNSLLLIDPMAQGFNEQSFRKKILGEENLRNTKIILIRENSDDKLYSLEESLDVDGMIEKGHESYEIAFVLNRLLFSQHANRRLHPRALTKLSGSFVVKQAKTKKECVSVDLSVAGAFVKTAKPLAIGTELELQFTIPNLPHAVQCKGTVVHNRKTTSDDLYPSGMGIRFDDIFASDRSKLFDYISSRFLRIERRATNRSMIG